GFPGPPVFATLPGGALRYLSRAELFADAGRLSHRGDPARSFGGFAPAMAPGRPRQAVRETTSRRAGAVRAFPGRYQLGAPRGDRPAGRGAWLRDARLHGLPARAAATARRRGAARSGPPGISGALL